MEVKENMTKDPVCGMNVDEKKAKFRSEHMGKTYYFCAESCKTTFDKNPSKFASGQSGHSCGCCC
jgi:YHS domain-containing protein